MADVASGILMDCWPTPIYGIFTGAIPTIGIFASLFGLLLLAIGWFLGRSKRKETGIVKLAGAVFLVIGVLLLVLAILSPLILRLLGIPAFSGCN